MLIVVIIFLFLFDQFLMLIYSIIVVFFWLYKLFVLIVAWLLFLYFSDCISFLFWL